MIKFILLIFVAWRLLLFVPVYIGTQFTNYRQGYEYTNIWKFTNPYPPVNNPLLFSWANFDGVHYLSIAGEGYKDNERFFPLYPILIKLFSFGQVPFSTVPFFAGLAISNIAFIAALILLYKLLKLDYKNNVATTTIIAILLFPTSFFFASIYSESLFLLLVILSFYFARRKQFFLSSLSAALVVLIRIVGIAILPALMHEILKSKGGRSRLTLLILPILSLLGFLLFNFYQFGNPLRFLVSQQEIANSREVFVIPIQTLFRYLNILTTLPVNQFEWWLALLELVTFFVVGVLLYLAWKKKVRFSYLIFALISFAIPVFSGTLSGLPRYSLVLFPTFIALALVENRAIQVLYFVLSPILLFLLSMLFSRGYFIG